MLLAFALAMAAGDASAQIVRRRFDPDDLELEKPGVVHADMAFGVVRGEQAGRWLAPDFDVDVGLTSNVELGIDGAWAIEGTPDRLFALDHRAPDNIWLSSKVGLFDTRGDDHDDGDAWAAGVQLGPRVALAPGARGAGFQALGLLGRSIKRVHGVLNVGGLVEPGAAISRQRPTALLVGVDLSVDLDEAGVFSIAADVSSVTFVSPEKNQLTSTAGLVWAAASWLDLSVTGLVGVLSGGDRYGGYLSVSPKVALF